MSYQPKHSARSKWRTPVAFGGGIAAALLGSTLVAPAGMANVAAALAGTAPCVATYNADGSTDIHCDAVTPPTTTASATASSTPSPTPSATKSPTPSPSPSPTVTPPGSLLFPGDNAGVPASWVPTRIYTSDLVVTTPGAVIENVALVNASIVLKAPNVTIRRVLIQGGEINTAGINSACHGHVIQDVTITRAPGQVTTYAAGPVIGPGGYTATNVKITGVPEGMRVSEKEHCGPVSVTDSYIDVQVPDNCNGDWHGDGLQGYDGAALTVRHSTFRMDGTSTQCDGTSPFFYPNQINTSANLGDVLAIGGRYYAFRLGTPGKMLGLYLVRDSKGQGGDADVRCSVLPGSSASAPANSPNWTAWHSTATSGPTGYTVTRGAYQPCNTPNGGQ